MPNADTNLIEVVSTDVKLTRAWSAPLEGDSKEQPFPSPPKLYLI
jgi:hypothetical protein